MLLPEEKETGIEDWEVMRPEGSETPGGPMAPEAPENPEVLEAPEAPAEPAAAESPAGAEAAGARQIKWAVVDPEGGAV